MSAIILLVALVAGQTQPEKPVTDAEKKEFLKVLATLPSKGEFFTEDGIKKAAPFTRVLFSLTEKDLEKYDIYPFVVLTVSLGKNKEARGYATTHFGKIAHQTIKLSWALVLFREAKSPPEVLTFLRKALESKKEARILSMMLGPGFEDFKEEVIRAYETGKRMKVELVKQHSIRAFPKYDGGFDYTNRTYVFAPGPLVCAVRPLQQRGELITHDLAKGTTSRRVVPQPKGFKPKYDFESYFDHPVLTVSSRGDLFCWWTLEGNGDHALALLRKGSDAFQANRVAAVLAGSRVVSAPGGAWYLIQTELGHFVVHHVGKELNLERLGRLRPRYSFGIRDARFITKDVLHLFSEGGDASRGGLRCADFDVRQRKWLHNRAILKFDRLVSLTSGTILQPKDRSLHYVWGIDDWRESGKKGGRLTGLYYQSEADATTLKIAGGHHHRAVVVGDRIVVCFTRKDAPDKVFFRVIGHGTLGPVTELRAAREREYNLSSEYMALYSEADRIWFVNTLAPNTLFELKLADVKKP